MKNKYSKDIFKFEHKLRLLLNEYNVSLEIDNDPVNGAVKQQIIAVDYDDDSSVVIKTYRYNA